MTKSLPTSWIATNLGAAKSGIPAHCRGCPVLKTGFFAALKGSSKELIAGLMVYGRYRRGQVLYQQGNPATRIYAVKSGTLKTYKTSSRGRQQLIDLLGPGDVFALESLFTGEHSVTAEVLADAEVCFFEKERFNALLSENQPLALELIKMLSESLVDCRNRLLDLGTKTARARLASFFMRMVPKDHGLDTSEAVVRLPLSRGEIADLIGVTPETISRLLQQLTRKKILAPDGKSVRVLDVHRLQSLTK